MKYPHRNKRVAGLLLPLSAVRSRENLGVGEFSDLPVLAAWCRSVGIELIQLLPVNDSGNQSSPYSTLSASALHPIYVRLRDLPELERIDADERTKILDRIGRIKATHYGASRLVYADILAAKMEVLRTVFIADRRRIITDPAFTRYVKETEWVTRYAVFRTLKEKNGGRRWTEWPEYREPDISMVRSLWDNAEYSDTARFYAWIQMRLAEQLRAAATTVGDLGVALKGDIPILMDEDSADVWYERDIFDRSLNAGAPPDMFSALGQNWRFPIYDWKRLAEHDYDWWRRRLLEAQRYYHAYRIDHVLGFFRIWAISSLDTSGITGFFWPQNGIGTDELHAIGMDDGRIRWLAEPHLRGEELRTYLDETLIQRIFAKIENEDLYLFRADLGGEVEIEMYVTDEEARARLISAYRDRILIALPNGRYATSWSFRSCSRYTTLSEDERDRFEGLVSYKGARDEKLWEEHGRRLLTVLTETTDMLTCAEDLGVIPETVPRVLTELKILGLRIPRWTHDWGEPGQPLIPVDRYPEPSVCAPSVHDTSTLREWWEKEEGREQLWNAVNTDEPVPERYDSKTAEHVLRYFAGAASGVVVYQIQDLLVLDDELRRDDPAWERVNVPGTYNDFNWSWRMPVTIEELNERARLSTIIRSITSARE